MLTERLQSQQTASIESKREDGRGHRQQGIAAKVAEATGLSKDTVRRALNPKPPRPQLVEVKDAFDVVTDQADAIVCTWNTSGKLGPAFGD